MRRAFLILGLAVAAALLLFWLLGGFPAVQARAAAAQREVQNALAGALRALRAGRPGAVAAFLTLCFSYGFLHAVGPGHGKLLIGAYGMGNRVRLLPLTLIAVLSSLAQAAFAVLVVYAGLALLGWTREKVLGVTEEMITPLGYAAFLGIGLWLLWRGARALRAAPPAKLADHHHAHDHDHDHHHHPHADDPAHVHDDHCGHRHGPTLDEIAALTSWREAAALIGAIALRPCSGTLFVLVLTWQMGIALMGLAGAVAIGLGTALVTVAVAALSVWVREGALQGLPGAGLLRWLPLVQLAAGALLALISLNLLIGAL